MRKAFDYDNARNDVFYEFVSYPRMLPFPGTVSCTHTVSETKLRNSGVGG